MNKKRVFLLLLVFIIPFLMPINAKAEEYGSIEDYICSEGNKTKLINKISKVKLSYEFIDEPSEEDKQNGYDIHFKIKVANMPESVYIKMGAYTYSLKKNGASFHLKQGFNPMGGQIKLEFYGDDTTPCYGQYVSSKSITLPKFNVYSLSEECLEYEEFSMCNKFYKGDIGTKENFLKELEKYKKSITDKKQQRENINIIDRIMSFIEDHQVLTAIVAFILVALILYIIIRKIIGRIKRTKIKM